MDHSADLPNERSPYVGVTIDNNACYVLMAISKLEPRLRLVHLEAIAANDLHERRTELDFRSRPTAFWGGKLGREVPVSSRE
jgi:hypothetical protein